MNIVKDCSYEDIVSNIDFYTDIFAENSLLIFKKINLTDIEQEHVFKLFASKLKWPHTSKIDKEEHLSTFKRRGRMLLANELFIEWHLEHLTTRNNTPIASCWNMTRNYCKNGGGNTGFINSSTLYDELPEKWKLFLETAIISNNITDNHERKCILTNKTNGKKILRLTPYDHKEFLLRINNQNPSIDDQLIFQDILKWVKKKVLTDKDLETWWNWSKGDLVMIDLLSIMHCVAGGFAPEERKFSRYWAFNSRKDELDYAF